MKSEDLFAKGQNCTGGFFRLDGDNFFYSGSGGGTKQIGKNITLSRTAADVIMSEKFGSLSFDVKLSFLPDGRGVIITDAYLNPEPSDEQWQTLRTKGLRKETFAAWGQQLKAMPPLELWERLKPTL